MATVTIDRVTGIPHIDREATGGFVTIDARAAGAPGAPGATGPPGSSGGPVPGGTATDGFLVVKDTAVAGLARYQDPATSALLLAKYVTKGELAILVDNFTGVDPTGATDSTTGINAAKTTASALGAVLRFSPGGIYLVTSLTIGSIRMEGYGATIRKTGSSISNWLTISATAVGTGFRGFTIDANNLVTGAVVNLAATTASYAAASSATDTITVTHALANGDKIIFTNTGAATGIVTGHVYYVVNVSGTATFKVALTLGGSPITLGTSSANINVYRQGVTDAVVEDNTILNATASAAVGVRVRDGASNISIRGNTLDGIYQGMYVDDACRYVTIDRNHIKNWVQRGIYVIGDATKAPSDISLLNNRVTDMATGGTVRQPIAFEGNDANTLRRIKVNFNTVIGPDKSWTAADPGTADNIGMHRCVDFEVIGNLSSYGGDCGMAIAAQCESGTISGNVCTYNDTPGLAIGAASTTFIRNIAVTGNTFVNNGQARNADRVNGRVGLWLDTADHIEVNGNVFADNQGTPTTQYGTYINGCTNIDFGHNTFNGLAVANHSFGASASVNITGTVTAPYVLTTPVTVGPSATGPTTIWSPTAWPLGTYVAGKTVLDLDLAGTIDCKATSGNFSAKILVNTVVVATIVVAATQTGANTNVNWNARAKIYVDTLGASGAISCVGAVVAPAAGGATWTTSPVGTYGTVVNLTTGLAVTVQLSMGTSDALNINRLNKAILRPVA